MPAPAVKAIRVPFIYIEEEEEDGEGRAGEEVGNGNAAEKEAVRSEHRIEKEEGLSSDANGVHAHTAPPPPTSTDSFSSAVIASKVKGKFVTNVFIELVSFSDRFAWLHISESTEHATPASKFGACCVALPVLTEGASSSSSSSAAAHRVNTVVSTLVDVESDGMQQELQVSHDTPQNTFARSLARRLVQRMNRNDTLSTPLTVYVCCAIEGPNAFSLLGGDGGSSTPAAMQFGGLVFRESLRLLNESVGTALQ